MLLQIKEKSSAEIIEIKKQQLLNKQNIMSHSRQAILTECAITTVITNPQIVNEFF